MSESTLQAMERRCRLLADLLADAEQRERLATEELARARARKQGAAKAWAEAAADLARMRAVLGA